MGFNEEDALLQGLPHGPDIAGRPPNDELIAVFMARYAVIAPAMRTRKSHSHPRVPRRPTRRHGQELRPFTA